MGGIVHDLGGAKVSELDAGSLVDEVSIAGVDYPVGRSCRLDVLRREGAGGCQPFEVVTVLLEEDVAGKHPPVEDEVAVFDALGFDADVGDSIESVGDDVTGRAAPAVEVEGPPCPEISERNRTGCYGHWDVRRASAAGHPEADQDEARLPMDQLGGIGVDFAAWLVLDLEVLVHAGGPVAGYSAVEIDKEPEDD